jgi:DNA-binding MarR family transcriptional regulator
MVKQLDEKFDALPDHIGWRLWQASNAWQEEFALAMREAGHGWFTRSRASLVGYVPRKGIKQSALIERAGITKQAVQQILDGLEDEGVIERLADPADARGKLVRYTTKGIAALAEGDRIKKKIERRYQQRLGTERFAALMDALRELQKRP